MDNNKKNDQNEAAKESIAKLIRVGAVIVAIAIVTGCFSYTKLSGAAQIGLFVVAGMLGIIGAFMIFIVAYGSHIEKRQMNFFLYDKKAKKDIPVSELTVAQIRERLIVHMSMFKHKGKLYIGDLFDNRLFTVPEAIKPLFCYELLCEIADNKGADASVFLSFGSECAEIFSKYLGVNNDHELALKIKQFFFAYAENNEVSAEFRNFIISKKADIEQNMLDYTVKNIDKFN